MKTIAIGSALATAVLLAPLAHAEGDDYNPIDRADSPRLAPAKAFELTISQGYGQGFGRAAFQDESLGDLGHAGVSIQLGLGYRIDPRFMVGVYAEGATFTDGSSLRPDATSYSGALGIEGNYHFMPFSSIDPWIGIGTGLRGYLVDRSDPGTKVLLGLDIVRLRAGADYKVSPSFSIGPVAGASLSRFGGYDSSESSGLENIDDRGMSTFVFAGIQGRIEIGGKRVREPSTVASR